MYLVSILGFEISGFIILVLCIIPSIFMRHKNALASGARNVYVYV